MTKARLLSDDEVAVTRPARKRAAKAPQLTSESTQTMDSPPSAANPPASTPAKTRSRTFVAVPEANEPQAPALTSEPAPLPAKPARVTRARKASPAADPPA